MMFNISQSVPQHPAVLEAELDVKKLEVKIRRQRQKVAAEFRSLTPDQRRELVVESPYVSLNFNKAGNIALYPISIWKLLISCIFSILRWKIL